MNIPKLPERPKYSYWRNVPNGPAEEKETNDVWIRWHDEVLVPWYASLFKDAVEVLGFNDEREISFCAKWDPGFQPTHKALLINMTPIKEETAEDILRELVGARDSDYRTIDTLSGTPLFGTALAKARAYLAAKEKK
jgi:hypothetical protein